MRTLWNVVSVMAVANLIALLVFVGWLWRSDRLDLDRIHRLRDAFATTISAEETAAQQTKSEIEEEDRQAVLDALRADPPLPSSAQIARTSGQGDRASQAMRRVQDQTELHRAELDRRFTDLETKEAAFAEREQVWEEGIADDAARRADEQFQKTVKLYEQLAGKTAKRMLLELVRQQNGDLDQAVAYLDAMTLRAATKTLKELKTEPENELATRLLERVRTFGTDAEAAELASNAATSPPDQ